MLARWIGMRLRPFKTRTTQLDSILPQGPDHEKKTAHDRMSMSDNEPEPLDSGEVVGIKKLPAAGSPILHGMESHSVPLPGGLSELPVLLAQDSEHNKEAADDDDVSSNVSEKKPGPFGSGDIGDTSTKESLAASLSTAAASLGPRVLSTDSTSSSPLSDVQGLVHRMDADDNGEGSFDGVWSCDRRDSILPPRRLARWAQRLRIHGSNVVLGTGDKATLKVRDGLVFLEKHELSRIGDILVRFGKSSTLVYEQLPEA
eukprot:TRINITY_DN1578_c0_g2_i1.p1 TRINITY_DN1578_c0_g2~~TRINITY_DN1578_c0_g2_i1.p1  ORF type:complete len:293 (+),score=9.94 TRINITY_DN1578_c0_g2_i1:107-880(+)